MVQALPMEIGCHESISYRFMFKTLTDDRQQMLDDDERRTG